MIKNMINNHRKHFIQKELNLNIKHKKKLFVILALGFANFTTHNHKFNGYFVLK